MSPIPVTILTGFLGSGKTTLLNQVLSDPQDRRIAVIVNEFGEIGIDGELVVGAEESLVELSNGCVCCTVREDLIGGVMRLLERRKSFDHLIIETTGLADPAPVLQTFILNEFLRNQCVVDGVVTVVDAVHFALNLDAAPELTRQVAFADLVLINKTDLVDQVQSQRVAWRVRELNRFARVSISRRAKVPISDIIEVGRTGREPALFEEMAKKRLDDDHRHADDIVSVGIECDGSMSAPLLYRWIMDILATNGRNIFRMKGIISLAGASKRVVLQSVHRVVEVQQGPDWQDEVRTNRLVLIGRGLDRATLVDGLSACLVPCPMSSHHIQRELMGKDARDRSFKRGRVKVKRV